ncbi:MAG: hypothetical protein HRU20_19410 [Pseudomonadales bacterium]|nr:hypothetical protein [Pseudomonadales bacterium]
MIKKLKIKALVLSSMASLILMACGSESSDPSPDPGPSDSGLPKVDQRNYAYITREINALASIDNRLALDARAPFHVNPYARLEILDRLSVDANVGLPLKDYFASEEYDVKDLHVSGDGQSLLFTAHGPQSSSTDHSWNIYEYSFVSSKLRRVIANDQIANFAHDTQPVYTKNGLIAFSSARQVASAVVGDPYAEALNDCTEADRRVCLTYYNEPASLLHTMTVTGQNITQITFGHYHDVELNVLNDDAGTLAFLRISQNEIGISQPILLPAPIFPAMSARSMISSEVVEVASMPVYDLAFVQTDGSQFSTYHANQQLNEFNASTQQITGFVLSLNQDMVYGIVRYLDSPVLGGVLRAFELQAGAVAARSVVAELIEPEANTAPGDVSLTGWYSAISPYDTNDLWLVSWSDCLIIAEDNSEKSCEASSFTTDVDVRYGLWLVDTKAQTKEVLIPAKANIIYTDLIMADY